MTIGKDHRRVLKGAIQISLPEPGAAEDVSGDQKGLVIVAVSFPT
jgi:hypothetical protein